MDRIFGGPTRAMSYSRVSLCLAAPVFALALLWNADARADARQEARRHFRKGMALIAAHDFDTGIAELEEAYAIKPHPNVLYNIARAYQDSERPNEAAQAYRRYLETNPEDREAVLAALAKLEASLAPAKDAPKPKPDPVRPEPTTSAPAEPTATTPAPEAKDEAETRRLGVLVTRFEEALNRLQNIEAARTLPHPPPAPSGVKPTATAPDLSAEIEADVPVYEEMVVSASKRAQITLEAPVATTVISAEEIRLSGARTIPELLRRVPGADVSIMGIASANVSLRGFNQQLSNKMLVLVDGRSVYEDYLGFTHWPLLAISLQDIERIEVMRGPGSTLYGANAFGGVVNIITRPAGSGPRLEARIDGGTGKTAGATLATSGHEGRIRYRASFGCEQANKWSVDYASDRTDVAPTAKNPDLGLRSLKGNATLEVGDRSARFRLSGGAAQVTSEFYGTGLLNNMDFDATEGYLQAEVAAGPMKLKSFWTHTQGTSEPQYWPIGRPSVASDLTSDVVDTELQLDQSFELLGQNHLVGGVGWRMKRARWTFLPSLALEQHFSAFVQDEWKPIPQLLFVGSYRVDRHPLLDKGHPGYAQSPRGTITYLITPTRALRASVSTAFRVPAFLESYLNVGIPLTDGAEAHVVGNPELKPEHIFNTELGYVSELERVTFEVALYRSVVTNLIEFGELTAAPPGTWNPATNRYAVALAKTTNVPGTLTAWGGEAGARASPFSRMDVRLNVAVEKITASDSSYTCSACSQAPFFKAFGAVSFRLLQNVDVSLDGAYVGGTTWVKYVTDKDDPLVPVVAHYPLSAYVVANARVALRLAGDRLELAFIGTNLAMAHREHPLGNLIERRFFTTLGGSL